MPQIPSFFGGKQILNPLSYANSNQKRETPPEEAFDRMLDAYEHSGAHRGAYEEHSDRIRVTSIPVEDAKAMFVQYVSHFESFYRSVSEALNDHMAVCASPSPIFADMRKYDLRSLFSQGYVVNADRRSGKTQALFDEADEVSKATSSRITIIAPRKEYVMAEANRRRLMNAEPNQFARLEFIDQDELHKLEGAPSRDVMVDEWWDLDERSRELLASRYNIMAAVGTMKHGTRVPIQARTIHDEDALCGRKESRFNPLAMARWSDEWRK